MSQDGAIMGSKSRTLPEIGVRAYLNTGKYLNRDGSFFARGETNSLAFDMLRGCNKIAEEDFKALLEAAREEVNQENKPFDEEAAVKAIFEAKIKASFFDKLNTKWGQGILNFARLMKGNWMALQEDSLSGVCFSWVNENNRLFLKVDASQMAAYLCYQITRKEELKSHPALLLRYGLSFQFEVNLKTAKLYLDKKSFVLNDSEDSRLVWEIAAKDLSRHAEQAMQIYFANFDLVEESQRIQFRNALFRAAIDLAATVGTSAPGLILDQALNTVSQESKLLIQERLNEQCQYIADQILDRQIIGFVVSFGSQIHPEHTSEFQDKIRQVVVDFLGNYRNPKDTGALINDLLPEIIIRAIKEMPSDTSQSKKQLLAAVKQYSLTHVQKKEVVNQEWALWRQSWSDWFRSLFFWSRITDAHTFSPGNPSIQSGTSHPPLAKANAQVFSAEELSSIGSQRSGSPAP